MLDRSKYKNTYFFHKGVKIPEFEGVSKDELKELLGGKGYGLYLMHCILDIRCPVVVNVPTFHANDLENGHMKKALQDEIMARLEEMEKVSGKKFGDTKNPLLVSARSGAKFSMPGMMDTILNIGLTDKIVDALAVGDNARFWRDSYRRLLQMYGDVVEQIKDENGEDPFEETLGNFKKEKGAKTDIDLTADDLAELIKRYKAVYVKYGHEFPQDPKKQVMASAEAVFRKRLIIPRIVTRRVGWHITHRLQPLL